MKYNLLSLSLGICLALVLMSSMASGQDFYNVSNTFTLMDFEWTHRGTFNMSLCTRMLINCWELVKPDVICSGYYYHESICGVLRHYCRASAGPIDKYEYYGNFDIQEGQCYYYSYGEYYPITRRRNRHQRNLTDYLEKVSMLIKEQIDLSKITSPPKIGVTYVEHLNTKSTRGGRTAS